MSESNNQPVNDVLERALAALRATQGSEGPPARVIASTIEALHHLDQTPDIVRLPERRKRMFTVLRYSGVAAVLMIAVALWSLDRNAGLTFAQVIENVQKAQSVRFELHQKLGSQPALETRMALQGDLAQVRDTEPPRHNHGHKTAQGTRARFAPQSRSPVGLASGNVHARVEGSDRSPA